MMADAWTLVRKEIKELIIVHSRRPLFMTPALALLLVLGIVIPWQAGPGWFAEPTTFVLWILLPTPLVIIASAESFAGERERHTLETLLASPLSDRAILTGKILAASLFGWSASVIVLLTGLITVNLVHVGPEFVLLPPALGLGVLALGLLTAALTASAGVMISLHVASVRQALVTLSLAAALLFLVVGSIGAIVLHLLPTSEQPFHLVAGASREAVFYLTVGALLLIAVDISLYLAALTGFHRSRLVAD
jgi:ABC-2 type transport system permease protein